MHKHKKFFGQHFLDDAMVIDNLVSYLNLTPHDQVVEIGPGIGAITAPMLSLIKHLSVVEIDRDCIKSLRHQFKEDQLTIYHQDVLTFYLHALGSAKYRIVGNLPYNISTPLLFHLYQQKKHIIDMHVMLQYEVAARICAEVNSSAYGRLSVMSQYYCTPTWLCDIGPESFNPPPKVNSAFIRLTPNDHCDDTLTPVLSDVVATAFNQRRKTIRNTLKKVISADNLTALNIDPTLRPQNISLAQYCAIARYLLDQKQT